MATDRAAADLAELATQLNDVARSVIEEDGEHAAMFFLRLPSGDLEVELFEPVERPVGEARGRQMASAVDRTGAIAVVMVSEAWSAGEDDVPPGSGAGDAPSTDDVLLVAAVDSGGNEIVLETRVVRKPDGTVELGESKATDGRVFAFAYVRALWGS